MEKQIITVAQYAAMNLCKCKTVQGIRARMTKDKPLEGVESYEFVSSQWFLTLEDEPQKD